MNLIDTKFSIKRDPALVLMSGRKDHLEIRKFEDMRLQNITVLLESLINPRNHPNTLNLFIFIACDFKILLPSDLET